ncbi:response regulator [Chitinophaga niabensis]|uniref:cAMP-binding domain of CRP or a regulatory subunit of cAMP-dependent protein kinases n=1 Tax=Chitinophaga niabensis TaxID=536979 RepID=A0A1N6D4Y4_9BACT|nr:response regulator [Chitinophaga niabensis]SIN65793.1 cAMP-binding domain of CRP or a regulatory subunit of cAMP-dependent protein kinases [Chitinophaga niabensis]
MTTILLIEDNADIRDNTAEILTMANYKVLTAADGMEGVHKAFEHKPDLIICDITMPVLDGYGVLHMLHKRNALQGTPFIFLTARAERSDMRKGMEMGADDFITKPFDAMELLQAIEIRISKAAQIKASNGFDSLLSVATGQLEALKSERNTNTYKKKQVIYTAGNRASYLFYVLKGKVKTSMLHDNGKELITGLYNEGDYLGYTTLLESGIYTDQAEAIEDAELALIPKADFDELINSNPGVLKRFIEMLAKNMVEKEEQLLGIAYNSLRKKVADALLSIHKKFNTMSIDISRDNLAAVAGVAKESLIRTLGDFRDEKLINIKEGDILLLDLKKLAYMLN